MNAHNNLTDESPVNFTGGRGDSVDSALRLSCNRIARSIGVELTDDRLDAVAEKAVQFVREHLHVDYKGLSWHRLAARREVWLVLLGLYRDQVRKPWAVARQREVARRVADAVLEARPVVEKASEEQQRLDPECWNLRPLDEAERALHICVLAEVVRMQDKELAARGDKGGESKDPRGAIRNALERACEPWHSCGKT